MQSEHLGIRPDRSSLVVLTFEENGINMLGVVFLFSQFSPIKKTVFNKIFDTPLKISTS